MTLAIINPATEEVIQEVAEDSPQSVQEKFHKAKQAQSDWSSTSLGERLEVIQKFRQYLVENQLPLAKTLTSEMGKPLQESKNELNSVLNRIDFFIQHVEAFYQEQIVWREEKLEEKITRDPLGVVANISAWNYPYFVGSNVFIPALLTGNTVLYKPSEFATLTGLSITEALRQAGVPEHVFIPIIGTGNIGAELLKQSVNGLFFTGSYTTGVKVAQAAALKLYKVQLELGGKDPVYVCEDMDPHQAATALAEGVFYNAGQSCCAVERIYVHQAISEAFIEAFVQHANAIRVGDPLDPTVTMGPLARKPQLDVLEAQVEDALSKGAQLRCGGQRLRGKGYFFKPTVLTQVNHTMQVMTEESFGPIIGVQIVQSDEEAVQLMNDTVYGLTAGVYTLDRERAVSLLQRMNTGSVYWNCCDRISPRLPWTGRQHSGLGSTLSHYGIETFFQPKAWHLRNA